jgi:hypothetical protein
MNFEHRQNKFNTLETYLQPKQLKMDATCLLDYLQCSHIFLKGPPKLEITTISTTLF